MGASNLVICLADFVVAEGRNVENWYSIAEKCVQAQYSQNYYTKI